MQREFYNYGERHPLGVNALLLFQPTFAHLFARLGYHSSKWISECPLDIPESSLVLYVILVDMHEIPVPVNPMRCMAVFGVRATLKISITASIIGTPRRMYGGNVSLRTISTCVWSLYQEAGQVTGWTHKTRRKKCPWQKDEFLSWFERFALWVIVQVLQKRWLRSYYIHVYIERESERAENEQGPYAPVGAFMWTSTTNLAPGITFNNEHPPWMFLYPWKIFLA